MPDSLYHDDSMPAQLSGVGAALPACARSCNRSRRAGRAWFAGRRQRRALFKIRWTRASTVDFLALQDRVKALGVRLGSARDAYRNADELLDKQFSFAIGMSNLEGAFKASGSDRPTHP